MYQTLIITACAAVALLQAATAHAEVITIEGTIKSVDAAKRTITVETEGEDKTLDVSGKVKITNGDKDAGLDSLEPGQKVKLSYHDELEIVLKIETTAGNPDVREAELVQISELTITPSYTSHSLSTDGTTIYWDGNDGHIWTAKRKTAEDRFSDFENLHITGRHPTISSDELEIVFVTARSDGKKGESLHVAKRKRKDEPFNRPTEISEFADKHGKATNKNPYLSSDGLSLYFNWYADDKMKPAYYSTRETRIDRWSKPKPLLYSQKDTYPNWPVVSRDGYFMLAFEVDAAQKSKLAVWQRKSTSEPFTLQQVVMLSDGEPISGRCAQYVPETNELFFSGNIGTETGVRMFCIKNFSGLVPSCHEAFSK